MIYSEFDKWLVSVGTAAAVEKMPGETVVASDKVVLAEESNIGRVNDPAGGA